MSYSNTITVLDLGKGCYSVTISETNAEATSEAVITGLPVTASLLKQSCALTGGSGATVDPVLGSTTNPSGPSVIAENADPAVAISNLASPAIPFATTTGTVYHRSKVNAGADNTIISRLLFKAGW
jgi:hypothetical protein